MGLFTTYPVSLNGRNFVYRGQQFDPKSTIGVFVEPASAMEAESRLNVKHDESGANARRRLLQHVISAEKADGTFARIIVNFTVSYDKNHSETDVSNAISVVVDAVSDAAFSAGFIDGLIE